MGRLMAKAVIWGVVAVAVAASGTPARAAGWAEALFDEKAHDFGPVPRGAKVRHPFVLTNRLQEPISIVDVRASCGCTVGRPSVALVPPGGTSIIEAEMDTRNFTARKSTTLTVSLRTASGREGEARLGVSSNILSDVVLNPGTVDFGVVARGKARPFLLTIDRTGLPSWKVLRMVSASRVIDASLEENARNANLVSYALTVSLKPDAPSGPVRDEIRLITNDPETQSIPILVTARIQGDLSASPAVLSLGNVASAGGAQGRFLVRASKPFRILRIDGEGDGFHLAPADQNPRPIHVLTVVYKPEESQTRGDLRRTFRVLTDLPNEAPLDLTATLHIDP